MSMRAKINFYASKVGEHPNFLHFMGAVLDDETRKLFFFNILSCLLLRNLNREILLNVLLL